MKLAPPLFAFAPAGTTASPGCFTSSVRRTRTWLVAATLLVVLCSATACGSDAPGDDDTNQDHNITDNDVNNHNDDSGDPEIVHTDAHQWCVAAERGSDGTLTAYHCAGPHDVSGFEAANTDKRWQPGAFQVIVE